MSLFHVKSFEDELDEMKLEDLADKMISFLENDNMDLNKCIEFDGPQHFKPIRFFGGKKSFDLQKKKDAIKNNFCKS
jgi:hypothetical protein